MCGQDMKSDIDNSALMMQMRGLRKSVQYLPRLGAWTLSVSVSLQLHTVSAN